MNTGCNTVDTIGQMNIQGNVIPPIWFRNISFPNGKPNFIAITLLSEILYWYRPTIIRDEVTGVITGINKKFKADKLQRNYQAFADQFGFTKRQVKEAIDFLEEYQLIYREFRDITIQSGSRLNNVMFIEPISENVKKITYEEVDLSLLRLDVPPPTLERTTLLHSDVPPSYDGTEDPPTPERKTNTIITTSITTDSITDIITEDASQEILGDNDERQNEKEIQLLEQKYIQLRGSGFFVSAKDLAAIEEVIQNNIPIQEALQYLAESFERYQPKYPGDKINGFAYCKSYILHQHYLSKQRKKVFEGGHAGDKHPKSPKTNSKRTSGPSEETRRLEGLAREKGLINKGSIRDIDVDF